jgi:hypothetical protein
LPPEQQVGSSNLSGRTISHIDLRRAITCDSERNA